MDFENAISFVFCFRALTKTCVPHENHKVLTLQSKIKE
jgi:hypothetical protein